MRSPPPVPTLEELRGFLCLGVSLLVATRDPKMAPTITRCGAARLDDDGLVRVAVPLPEGTRALADLDGTSVIALTAARPTTYRTLQVKGRDARRLEWPGHERIAAAHRSAFVAEVTALGLPRPVAAGMWSRRFATIAFTPHEIFDQTPGPSAGLTLLA